MLFTIIMNVISYFDLDDRLNEKEKKEPPIIGFDIYFFDCPIHFDITQSSSVSLSQ